MSPRDGGLALLLAVAGCASAPVSGAGTTTVDAEGRGADAPQALADALKRAVEQALGVSLAASTRVEGAVAVRRRIWADSRGRVERWTVLGEHTRDKMTIVRVRAVVRRPADDEAVPPPDGTKIRLEAAGAAEAGLRRGLGARGLVVVERGEEFIVRARGGSTLLHDARTGPFVSVRGKVTVSVIESASGAVLWEKSSEAAGLDTDSLAAANLAMENAGELGGRDAADGLARALWNR